MAQVADRWKTLAELLKTCGSPATLAVTGGGLCLGAMLWRNSFAGASSTISNATLPILLVLGMLATFALWIVSCAYAAKRFPIDIVAAMRFDALAYAGLVAYPIVLLLPLGNNRQTAALAAAATLFVAGTLVAIARFDAAMRTSLWVFTFAKIPIVAIALVSSAFVPEHGSGHPVLSPNRWLNVFARWDAVHYITIAREGYRGTDTAFFPLYPLAIRLGGWLLGSDVVAALLISNVAFLLALFFLYRIARAQFDSEVAQRAVLYLAIFPTAFFFTSIYSESLFLMLTLAMFYYLRENRWLLAGFVGGLAALTRSEGVLLLICYVVEVLAPERNIVAALRQSVAVRKHLAVGAAMIPAGLLAYMVLLWVLTSDPFAFSHVQSHWHRQLSWPWVSVWRSIVAIATSHDAATVAEQSVEFVFAALIIVTTVYGLRKIRPSYSAFAILSVLAPLSTSSLMSTPRFALAIFPLFLILGLWGRNQYAHTAILVYTLPFLGFFTVLFANWFWVA